MGGACSTYGWDKKCRQNFGLRASSQRPLEDLGTDERITLEQVLNRQGGRVWAWFIWLRIGTSGGNSNKPSVKDTEFRDLLSDYRLVKKDSVPWNKFVYYGNCMVHAHNSKFSFYIAEQKKCHCVKIKYYKCRKTWVHEMLRPTWQKTYLMQGSAYMTMN
jgi:hypothetical protein